MSSAPLRWGYGRKNGPETWNQFWDVGAKGSRQSPIDIPTAKCVADSQLASQPLLVRYEPHDDQLLTNTGAGWKVDYGETGGSTLTGGPLGDDVYVLEQFHCHWGGQNGRGSEHTVDGKRSDAELHLVHYNRSRYGNFSKAAAASDGLAVIGVMLQAGGAANAELEKVNKALKQVPYSGQTTKIAGGCDPDKFLPEWSGQEALAYWTYEGSLTTPPLFESVTWIVLQKPVTVSDQQLAMFRQLYRRPETQSTRPTDDLSDDDDDGKIVDNFRPPVPLGSRTIRSCGVTRRFQRK